METEHKPTKRLRCSFCGRRAVFYSRSGLLCPDDALLDAMLNDWIPRQLNDQEPRRGLTVRPS